MSCEKCNELSTIKEIQHPDQLRKVFKVISDKLEDNVIREIRNIKLEKKMVYLPFSEIDINGPWDDIICYYFECLDCKQKFCVHAETYHGRGGRWEPVDKIF